MIALNFRPKLKVNSLKFTTGAKNELRAVEESFATMEDILIGGYQNHLVDEFVDIDIPMRESRAFSIFLGASPRFILETLGIFLLFGIGFWKSISTNELENSDFVPVLATFALGAQKLLPVLQQLFSCWSRIKAQQVPLEDIAELIEKDRKYRDKPTLFNKFNSNFQSIIFNNVSFKFKNEKKPILSDISLEINRGDYIGILGETGSGKSTLVRLIAGLLEPTNGDITIVENPLLPRKPELTSCSYVSQNTYIFDDTIKNNIELNIEGESSSISYQKAACLASISEFIENLPRKYETIVGDKGSNLSGGQRQRLSLARAIKKDPSLLILDEVTSSLDALTTNSVLENIRKINLKGTTIISISHDINAFKHCTKIFEVKTKTVTLNNSLS